MSTHAPLPWEILPGNPYWSETVVSSDRNRVTLSDFDPGEQRDILSANRRIVVRSVNLIGPHLDDPARMRVFESVAGMDTETFAVFVDRMHEVGFLGGE